MGACELATEFAIKMSEAHSIEELDRIAGEVKVFLKDLMGWEDWLRDEYRSNRYRIGNISESK
jgi:hypothetical protein